MSHIMEKTLASLPKLLSQSLGNGANSKTHHRQLPSMDVQQFMKQIHKAQSQSQEAAIVKSQLQLVKKKLKDIDLTSPSIIRGCFTKLIFCYQLGYDVSEMAIDAFKLAHQGRGFDKRLGYLVSCLLLHSHHDFTILMTSTILRDLTSPNMTDNCLALEVAGELMDVETIPFLLPEVIKRFSHQQDLVKEKALRCFKCFYLKAPELLDVEIPRLKIFLASRDPGVLMAVVDIYVILTSRKPTQFVGLSLSFTHILDQINSRGFGSVYYYNMVALPWLQINLLKVLCNLAQVDTHLCTRLEPMLKALIEKTKVTVPISLAILVESIQTATKINASESLLHFCSRCIMKLMATESSENMKYQGLGLLISLSKVKPSYTSQHQAAVMECLSSSDHAIQSRTTYLLHAMANAANVRVICDKLFEQQEIVNDKDFQREILEMIINLIEKILVDIEWYVTIYFRVLSCGIGIYFKDRVANSIIAKIEQLHKSNKAVDSNGLTNILEQTFLYLEEGNFSNHEYIVRLQLLGVLVPLIPNQFQAERFFNILTPCIFSTVVCDNDTIFGSGMMKPPGQWADSQNESYGSSLYNEDIRFKVICIEIVIKLVLSECIDSHSVTQWLEKNDYKSLSFNGFLHGILRELENLVLNPLSLRVKSHIMFHTQPSELDLSLSFLDTLVVQDLLKGANCYTPAYVKEAERSKRELMASALTSPSEYGDGNVLSVPQPTDFSSSNQEWQDSRRKPRSKWQENDDITYNVDNDDIDDQFLFIGAEPSRKMETDKNRKELAEQLFAGLNSSKSNEADFSLSDSGISSSGTKGLIRSGRNIWEDDDCEDAETSQFSHQSDNVRKSSFLGMELRPFGISKKVAPKAVIWRDEENVQTEGLVLENISLGNHSAGESLYNSQNMQSYPTTYGHNNSLEVKSLDCPVIQDGMSLEVETGLSLYSEFSDDHSPVLTSPDFVVSAVDTLTDSDPEES